MFAELLFLSFAVWVLWIIAAQFLEFPDWAWRCIAVVLGVGGVILVERDDWYLGIGVGGFAAFLVLVADLLLVTSDWVRVAVLRHTRR